MEVLSRIVDEVVVLVHSANTPADGEWDQVIELQRRNPTDRTLVVTAGGGPSNPQRMRMNAALKEKLPGSKVAVVSSSRMVRGIVAAMSWFNPGIRSFGPEGLDDALAYLDIEAAKHSLFRRTVDEMHQELNGSPALQ